MNFWRGKIGYAFPGRDWPNYVEWGAVLPEGVVISVTTLGLDKVRPEDFEENFSKYPDAIRYLASQECNVVIAGGTALWSYMGSKRTEEMIQEVRKTVKVPVLTDISAHVEALRAVSAKKIILISPYEGPRNEERGTWLENAGFEVINTKSIGLQRRLDIQKLPSYTTYRLAKEAFLETPEADAIYITNPAWETVANIEKLEYDTGKPVVSHVTGVVWAALRAMNVREPIKGYGRLMQLL